MHEYADIEVSTKRYYNVCDLYLEKKIDLSEIIRD